MAALSFTWTLQHHGWAFCRVTDGQAEAEAMASYVTGGPEQFLYAIARLALTEPETRAEFEAEPRWFFRREGAEVEMRLVMADDFQAPDSSGSVLWSSRQPIDVLCRAAIRAFDQVAHDLGEDGYEAQWGRPFPRNELQGLRTAWRGLQGVADSVKLNGSP
ncbi:hypothetical protein ACH492_37840 [Streptomyces sp. NPDC019443]|uniref:hypothetical protein n=1 Tax=Streptomyces sp. NPDC019443 TaxID=3365061 RepID=UPI00379BD735